MTPPGGTRRFPGSAQPGAPRGEVRTSATLDRAAGLVDGLRQRALRQERVLEVLDLRAARSARKLADRLHAAATRWASETDALARSMAASELLELMDAAAMVLLVGDAPAPSTERPAAPTSSVVSKDARNKDELITEERVRLDSDAPVASADADAWQAMLGVPRRRPLT